MKAFSIAAITVFVLFSLHGALKTIEIERTINRAKTEQILRNRLDKEREYKQRYKEIFGWLDHR